MVGYTDHKAWDFLDDLYAVGNVKGSFDAAALHPYGSDLEQGPERVPAVSPGDEGERRRADAALGQ